MKANILKVTQEIIDEAIKHRDADSVYFPSMHCPVSRAAQKLFDNPKLSSAGGVVYDLSDPNSPVKYIPVAVEDKIMLAQWQNNFDYERAVEPIEVELEKTVQ